jgi:hypothetical protein
VHKFCIYLRGANLSRSDDLGVDQLDGSRWGKPGEEPLNGTIQILQGFEAPISRNLRFQCPPDLLDRIEFVSAIGGQIHQFQEGMIGDPIA